MLNFTEKYMQMTQDNIINGKNKMKDMHSILLTAQDDKKFNDCGIWFTTNDWGIQAFELGVAIVALRISIDSNYSRIKKELFLKRMENSLDYIGSIGIRKIEKPNLIVFGSDVWFSELSGDHEEDELEPYERKNRKDNILVVAYEHDRPNCAISWRSNVEKKNGQWIITETLKEQKTDEEIGSISPLASILSQSFKLLDMEDPIGRMRAFMARENFC